jgi:hypothetical protein
MKFFYKLERKYNKYAIPNLMYYIIAMYITGMLMMSFAPMFYYQYLALDAEAILHGQIWRIVTFMIYPPYPGPFSAVLLSNAISLYLYYVLGMTLERIWGSFRFNVYFFMGVIGHVLAAIILYVAFGQKVYLNTTYLNYSLFFAFAVTFPNMEFLLFFAIPIKAKWMGLFNGFFFFYNFVVGGTSERITIVMALLNFILFFLMTRNTSRLNPKEIRRKHNFQKQVKIKPNGTTHHKCAVCGRTEKDDPDLEFRYCSKCQGSYEYCSQHLYTHKHVTGENPTPGETN